MFIAGSLNIEPGEKIYVGASTAIHSPDPSSHAEYIEYSGQGLGAVEKEIDKCEQQMAVLGARLLEPQRAAAESADGKAINRKGEESVIGAMANNISEGITNVLVWFVDWLGYDTFDVAFKLNNDYQVDKLSPQMLTSVVSAWQAGLPGFDGESVFKLMQKNGIIDGDVEFNIV
jgi:hypothetical protein